MVRVYGLVGAGVENGLGPAPRNWLLRATVAQVSAPKSYLRQKNEVPAPALRDTCARVVWYRHLHLRQDRHHYHYFHQYPTATNGRSTYKVCFYVNDLEQ